MIEVYKLKEKKRSRTRKCFHRDIKGKPLFMKRDRSGKKWLLSNLYRGKKLVCMRFHAGMDSQKRNSIRFICKTTHSMKKHINLRTNGIPT